MEKPNLAVLALLVLGLGLATAYLLMPTPEPEVVDNRAVATRVGAKAKNTAGAKPTPSRAKAKQRREQNQRAAHGASAAGPGQGTPQDMMARQDETHGKLRDSKLAITERFARDQGLSEEATQALMAEMTQLLDDSQAIYQNARKTPGANVKDTRRQLRKRRKASEANFVDLLGVDQTAELISQLRRP